MPQPPRCRSYRQPLASTRLRQRCPPASRQTPCRCRSAMATARSSPWGSSRRQHHLPLIRSRLISMERRRARFRSARASLQRPRPAWCRPTAHPPGARALPRTAVMTSPCARTCSRAWRMSRGKPAAAMPPPAPRSRVLASPSPPRRPRRPPLLAATRPVPPPGTLLRRRRSWCTALCSAPRPVLAAAKARRVETRTPSAA
mmetsp:Transcript_20699/g.66790  ORF Transcript_20699/g.66790 Transcript_20699/m.66790 type:complete len:201 (-) Transcript_20699:1855-2457(-)